MNYIIISYDITSNKKRRKVSDILEGYGNRVNRSLFECIIKNKSELDSLVEKIRHEVDLEKDSVRLYFTNSKDIDKSFAITNEADPFENDKIKFM